MKKLAITIAALSLIILTLMPHGIEVRAISEPESAAIEQALPYDGKYFSLITFSESDVYWDMPVKDSNHINKKMDYYSRVGKNSSYYRYTPCSFHICNVTYGTPDRFGIFSSAWTEYCMTNNSYTLRNFGVEVSPETTYVNGGYQLVSMNEEYYQIESNTTLMMGSGPYPETCEPLEQYDAKFAGWSIDPIMWYLFNVSTGIVFSKTNLTAYLVNGSEWIKVDNPLYFNKSALEKMELLELYALHGCNYSLVEKSPVYYKLQLNFNFSHITEFPYYYRYEGEINRTFSIFIKPSGELWGYEILRHYTDMDRDYLQYGTYGGMELSETLIATWDRIQFWFEPYYYIAGNNFKPASPWKDLLLNSLIIGLPVVGIVGGIYLGKKHSKKKKKKAGASMK